MCLPFIPQDASHHEIILFLVLEGTKPTHLPRVHPGWAGWMQRGPQWSFWGTTTFGDSWIPSHQKPAITMEKYSFRIFGKIFRRVPCSMLHQDICILFYGSGSSGFDPQFLISFGNPHDMSNEKKPSWLFAVYRGILLASYIGIVSHEIRIIRISCFMSLVGFDHCSHDEKDS